MQIFSSTTADTNFVSVVYDNKTYGDGKICDKRER